MIIAISIYIAKIFSDQEVSPIYRDLILIPSIHQISQTSKEGILIMEESSTLIRKNSISIFDFSHIILN
jgi:hypothetical protein